jgi:hypothetical protein
MLFACIDRVRKPFEELVCDAWFLSIYHFSLRWGIFVWKIWNLPFVLNPFPWGCESSVCLYPSPVQGLRMLVEIVRQVRSIPVVVKDVVEPISSAILGHQRCE